MKTNSGFVLPSAHHAPPKRSLSRDAEDLLIDRILSGRIDAFGDLVQPYMRSLNRFAQHKLQNEAEAEDVVQQSILLAFRHLRQFRRDASFSTWLRAIAINEVLGLLQRRSLLQVPLREPVAADLADTASSPLAQCEQKERAERLHQALIRLPEKYRLMIQLRDLAELSITETARSLSLSSAAVRTRHHRARKLLVRSLAALPTSSKCLQTANA